MAEDGFERQAVAILDVTDDTTASGLMRALPGAGNHLLFLRRDGVIRERVVVDGTVDSKGRLERALEGCTGPTPDIAMRGTSALTVSVVVPCLFRRLPELHRCLRGLLDSDYERFEVVLVDNSADRASRRADLPTDDRVRLVWQPTPGIAAARNAGIGVATGEVVAFTDDDAVVDGTWLRRVADRFSSEPVDCVTGLVVPLEIETDAQLAFETFGGFARGYALRRYQQDPDRKWTVTVGTTGEAGVSTQQLPLYVAAGNLGVGANMAFRTGPLRALGGFSELLGAGTRTHGGEEVAMFARLLARGGRLAYDPAVVVMHQHRQAMPELCRQVRGGGVSVGAWLAYTAVTEPWVRRSLLAELPTVLPRRWASVRGRPPGQADRPGPPGAGPPRPDVVQRELHALETRSVVMGPTALLASVGATMWRRVTTRRVGRRVNRAPCHGS